MNKLLPPDAFEAYVALGQERSYATLARNYGVSKRCVTREAARGKWIERLSKIEEDARAASDRRVTETLADMHERHVKMLKVMGARVVTALRDHPIDSGMDAIRAADITIKLERLIAGEVSKRTELNIEEITRHEIRTLLKVVDDDDEPRTIDLERADNELLDEGDDEQESA